jgi:hypothetical protein
MEENLDEPFWQYWTNHRLVQEGLANNTEQETKRPTVPNKASTNKRLQEDESTDNSDTEPEGSEVRYIPKRKRLNGKGTKRDIFTSRAHIADGLRAYVEKPCCKKRCCDGFAIALVRHLPLQSIV